MEKLGDGALRVHRLVQQTQLDRISGDARNHAFDTAIGLIRDAFPKQVLGMHMHKFWPQCESFLAHALALESAYRERQPTLEAAIEFVELLCDVAW